MTSTISRKTVGGGAGNVVLLKYSPLFVSKAVPHYSEAPSVRACPYAEVRKNGLQVSFV